METRNLISAFESRKGLEEIENLAERKITEITSLKKEEGNTLKALCKDLSTNAGGTFDILDGYYIGYKIPQISREFDLLRFSDNLVINIELKSDLSKYSDDNKKAKILKQMKQNYYYLKALDKEILIYTYVENDGLYMFDNHNYMIKSDIKSLIKNLKEHKVNYSIDPEKIFIPSNYLISPFNKTEKFINDEYFLNEGQSKIKKEIINSINDNKFFCISANAGTGKTLLMYDIIKSIKKENINSNDGHEKLISDYNWNIVSISELQSMDNTREYINDNIKAVFVDESQRIREEQLKYIVNRIKELDILAVFSYDVKQYLSTRENKDIYEYLQNNYNDIVSIKKTLTNRIRTNENIHSFIRNLFNIGSCNHDRKYDDVTIEYFSDYNEVKKYLEFLKENHDWTPITFTSSNYNFELIIMYICDLKAHNVIGQEFDKVVLVMDKNFKYGENNKIMVSKTYYSMKGMLYQILTRVISKLKIVVLDNPELYLKLVEIKSLGTVCE